jgi:hypothetical protein
MSARNMAICRWCCNQMVDVCPEKCQPEGRYRYLVPDAQKEWEPKYHLPPFRELIDWPAQDRLALLYLCVFYNGLDPYSSSDFR